MTDNKRLSLGGRVATPRLGNIAPSAMPLDTALPRCIGAKIRVTTIAPHSQTLEQYIYSLNPSAALLVITPAFPPPLPYPRLTLLPFTAIQSFTILSLPSTSPGKGPNSSSASSGTSTPVPPAKNDSASSPAHNNQPTGKTTTAPAPAPAGLAALPAPMAVDPALQHHRLRTTLSRLRAEEARRGKGVSREAQDIFDALARTLPARWDRENIVVLDNVVIARPYRPEDCRAAKGVSTQMLARVQKVLESERRKLAEKGGGTPEPRKGG